MEGRGRREWGCAFRLEATADRTRAGVGPGQAGDGLPTGPAQSSLAPGPRCRPGGAWLGVGWNTGLQSYSDDSDLISA